MLAITAFAALAAWIGLALVRLRPGAFLPDLPPLRSWPEVVAIVPARDEADVVQRTIGSLLRQDYGGRLTVILVDDHSRDGTAEIARRVTGRHRLEIVQAPPLRPGWTGKLAAQQAGLDAAREVAPDASWILLTDADIEHDPASIRRLVAMGETNRLDLVSLMALLHCGRFWERLLIPAFVFFFQKLYPFRLAADPASPVAAAAGGCVLLRRDRFESLGGFAPIRGELIDDCALARLVKNDGGRLWLGLTRDVRSIRPYVGLRPIWDMVARTAYTQLRYSPLLLAGTVIGMILLYLVPPLALLAWLWTGSATAALAGLVAWLVMAFAYLPTVRLYGQPPAMALTLPAAALLYTGMTLDSARRHLQGRGGGWKGRVYAAPGEAS
ncbi:MAG: glycosyltransferase [Geminicoccaceae bacterium]